MGSTGKSNNEVEEKFEYKMSKDLKSWSDAEEKRTKDISDMLVRLDNAGDGDFQQFYEPDSDNAETVYKTTVGEEYGFRNGTEIEIYKEYYVYASNWDENDRRVKKGKKVPGTVHYTVSVDGDYLDDNHLGYKTLKDAQHDLALNLDWYKQREDWNKKKRR